MIFIFSYSLSIYTFIFKAFIIHQKKKHLFLEFKVHSLIYYNLLSKVTNFIIIRFINFIKREYFASVKSSIINYQLRKL